MQRGCHDGGIQLFLCGTPGLPELWSRCMWEGTGILISKNSKSSF